MVGSVGQMDVEEEFDSVKDTKSNIFSLSWFFYIFFRKRYNVKTSHSTEKEYVFESEALDESAAKDALKNVKDNKKKIQDLMHDLSQIDQGDLPQNLISNLDKTVTSLDDVIEPMEVVTKDLDSIKKIVLDPVSKSLTRASSMIDGHFKQSSYLSYFFGVTGILVGFGFPMYERISINDTKPTPVLSQKNPIVNRGDSPIDLINVIRNRKTNFQYEMLEFKSSFLDRIKKASSQKASMHQTYLDLDNQLTTIATSNPQASKTEKEQLAIAAIYLELYNLLTNEQKLKDYHLRTVVEQYQLNTSSDMIRDEFKWLEAQIFTFMGKHKSALPLYSSLTEKSTNINVIDLKNIESKSIKKAAMQARFEAIMATKKVMLLNSGLQVRTKPIGQNARKYLLSKGYSKQTFVNPENFFDTSSAVHGYYRDKNDLLLLNKLIKDLGLRSNQVDITQYDNIRNSKIKQNFFNQKKLDVVIRLPDFPLS